MGRYGIVGIVFLCLLLLGGTGALASGDNLLPPSGFSNQWPREGAVKRYTAENLYVYINGEAELFLPFGFQTLHSAIYVNREDPRAGLVADVYVMGSLLDAFGIYSYYRGQDADLVTVGVEGFLSESQLMFYKDRYFVRLAASGENNPEGKVFLACAEAIARHLPGGLQAPNELRLLRGPGIQSDSVRYIAQSVLGYSFFRQGLTADAQVSGATARVFIILGGSRDGAARAMDEYGMYLKKAGVDPRMVRSGDATTLVAMDPLYKGIAIRQKGPFLLGVARLRDGLDGIGLIDSLETQIRNGSP